MEGIPFVFLDVEVYEYDGVYAIVANNQRVLDLTKDAAMKLISELQEALCS